MAPKPHCPYRSSNRLGTQPYSRDDLNRKAPGAKMFDIAVLVAKPAFAQYVEKRIPKLGLGYRALGNRKIKLGQIPAIEVPYQVRRAELNALMSVQHCDTRRNARLYAKKACRY